jgi:hypothetical protein
MRLVAVSIVKNEADIIEAFVRHTRAWTDHHLVFDHDSTDGTREILVALREEGLPLSLFTDDALGNLQQERSNHLVRLAASSYRADWILPLDADEILCGPGRAALESRLAAVAPGRPAMLGLSNYYPTTADDPSIVNPVLRLRYCQDSAPRTFKVAIPQALASDPDTAAGKGSHALFQKGSQLPAESLPADFFLAHLALRSPEHQALRVVLAELQKLSRGRAHAGLDLHYRLGFQILSEDPERFFALTRRSPDGFRLRPIPYQGGPLRQSPVTGWARVARAILPYLERLAASHGKLWDRQPEEAGASPPAQSIPRELRPEEMSSASPAGMADAFTGFTPVSGWSEAEGPVPEAYLPRFHWGYAPRTELLVETAEARHGRLVVEALTYSDQQAVTVALNGEPVLEHAFGRTNQKELFVADLPMRAGRNRLEFAYARSLTTEYDPRRLAVIFLSLRIAGLTPR